MKADSAIAMMILFVASAGVRAQSVDPSGCYDITMGIDAPVQYEVKPAADGEFTMRRIGSGGNAPIILKAAAADELQAVRGEFPAFNVRYGLTVKWPEHVPDKEIAGMFWITDKEGDHIICFFTAIGEAKKVACP